MRTSTSKVHISSDPWHRNMVLSVFRAHVFDMNSLDAHPKSNNHVISKDVDEVDHFWSSAHIWISSKIDKARKLTTAYLFACENAQKEHPASVYSNILHEHTSMFR
jgi:hypothetical protein